MKNERTHGNQRINEVPEGVKLFDDTTAEERYYARSMKIRMGTLELLLKLADLTDKEKPVTYETIDELGNDAANWIKKGGWDRKAASAVTANRWIRQYISRLGPFKIANYGPSSFAVIWRDGYSRAEVVAELARFRRKV